MYLACPKRREKINNIYQIMKKVSLGVFKIVIESITCASSFEVSELLSFLIISLGRNIEGSLGIF